MIAWSRVLYFVVNERIVHPPSFHFFLIDFNSSVVNVLCAMPHFTLKAMGKISIRILHTAVQILATGGQILHTAVQILHTAVQILHTAVQILATGGQNLNLDFAHRFGAFLLASKAKT
jgi:hypothetical protein